MDDSSIDEMVTGQPSLESRAKIILLVFMIGCLVYAMGMFLWVAFILWLGSITEP